MKDPKDTKAMVVFVRLPKPGQVKTRLAKGIGKENACIIYDYCAKRIMREMSKLPRTTCYVFFSVAEEKLEVERWIRDAGIFGNDPNVYPQKQVENLGLRIVDAFKTVYRLGHREIGIVGTDIPDLSSDVVCLAYEAMDAKKCPYNSPRAILGPSLDGGFYMMLLDLGCSGSRFEIPDNLFEGVLWSNESTMKQTIDALKEQGFDINQASNLPILRDIDELEDLKQWSQEQEKNCPDNEMLQLATSILQQRQKIRADQINFNS
jgi:glycosyltransferase A (GT-A) superfamily protein (DUF2064 family)